MTTMVAPVEPRRSTRSTAPLPRRAPRPALRTPLELRPPVIPQGEACDPGHHWGHPTSARRRRPWSPLGPTRQATLPQVHPDDMADLPLSNLLDCLEAAHDRGQGFDAEVVWEVARRAQLADAGASGDPGTGRHHPLPRLLDAAAHYIAAGLGGDGDALEGRRLAYLLGAYADALGGGRGTGAWVDGFMPVSERT